MNNFWWIAATIIIIAIIGVLLKSHALTDPSRHAKRKGFSQATIDSVKIKQQGKCAMCGVHPTHWEFDHIGSRGDNTIDNCQGLCSKCHKTRR